MYTGEGEAYPAEAGDSSLQAPSSVDGLNRDEINRARASLNTGIRRSDQYEDMSEAGAVSMTSTMENMVNDLTSHDGPEMDIAPTIVPRELVRPSLEILPTRSPAGGQTSSIPRSIPALDNAAHSSRHSIGSLPGQHDRFKDGPGLPTVWSTPFTPRPEDMSTTSRRPSTAHRVNAAIAPSSLNSPALFQADILQMQEQIQNRSSPPQSFQPTMSSPYETPTNLTSWIKHIDRLQPSPSPWQNSSAVAGVHETVISTRSPEPSPFGAIGEPRARSGRAPTSGQPG